MGSVQVELDQDLVELLEELRRPAKEAARELIVLELYRQGEVSSGKAAELLPYLQLSDEEVRREIEDSESL